MVRSRKAKPGEPHMQTIRLLSVWEITYDEGAAMKNWFYILAHVLFSPVRVILIPLDPLPACGLFSLAKTADQCLDFRILYAFLHACDIPWRRQPAPVVKLINRNFSPHDWDVLRL